MCVEIIFVSEFLLGELVSIMRYLVVEIWIEIVFEFKNLILEWMLRGNFNVSDEYLYRLCFNDVNLSVFIKSLIMK